MKRFLRRLGLALVVVLVLVLVYGVLVEPRLVLDVRRYEWPVPGVAGEWEGAEVAAFSDLQVGMWFANLGMAERAVAHVVTADPDAVLLAGDFIYGESPDVPAQVDTVMSLLAPIVREGIPAFAVMGNHDHTAGAVDELVAAFERHGIRVLDDEAVTLPASGDAGPPLWVVGLGARRPGPARPAGAFPEVPDGAPRVVFMHNPDSFPALPPDSAPLAVAGHTHCGQVAVPGLPFWSYLELREEERVVADGFAPASYGAAGNALFVTCGIGFSLVPVRINAAPQVVYFELVPPG